MAETDEETVGHVANAPPQADEAPTMHKDVAKENGELPASENLPEIDGKEKEDPTLTKSAPAPEETAEEPPVTTENAMSKEIPEAEVEAHAKSADSTESEPTTPLAEEETSTPVETAQTEEPKTEVADGKIPEPEDPSKSDEPETEVGEAEPPMSSETGEKEAVVAGAEETPKPEKKVGHASEVAGEAIPKTVDVPETDHPNTEEGAAEEVPKTLDTTVQPQAKEVVAEEIPKTLDTTETEAREPQTTEDTTPKPSEADVPQAAEEPEQPSAEEPSKRRSFWGVVLKHVEPNGKSEDSTSVPSSNPHYSNDVEKSPEEGHEKKPVGPPQADVTEQEIAHEDAAASDISHEKERGTAMEEAPKAVTENQTTRNEVNPGALVSGPAEPSENATTVIPESLEQRNVDDSAKETGLPTSEVEEKQIPSLINPEQTLVSESIEEPKGVSTTITPEQTPVSARHDTTEQLTQETPTEAKPEEGTSLPVMENAVEENQVGEHGSALEKQPSLSIYIPKEQQPSAAAEETTPRGTPLMQRVEQLEDKLAQLEGRQSPRSDFTPTEPSTPRSSSDKPIRHSALYVLEETGSKGTLLDRVSALEHKLTYYFNLHPTSPSNGQSTPPIPTVAEDLVSEPDSKPAESQTRDWSPPAVEDDKTPEQVKEEASKAAQDPVKPTTEDTSPEDLPAPIEGAAPSRSTSLNEKKIKARAAVGKIRGLVTGCFSPKAGKPVPSSS